MPRALALVRVGPPPPPPPPHLLHLEDAAVTRVHAAAGLQPPPAHEQGQSHESENEMGKRGWRGEHEGLCPLSPPA
jgi:hypothetical protein